MGCDIHGWIEEKASSGWRPLAEIGILLNRDYDMFGLLFGVRNYCGFNPIADHRGIPEDVSEFVKNAFINSEDYHSPSWITLDEIVSIDPNMASGTEDQRVHIYNKEGIYTAKAVSSGNVTWHTVLSEGKDGVLERDGNTYKIEKVKAVDGLKSPNLQFVIELMKKYCWMDELQNIRMVVWFDN